MEINIKGSLLDLTKPRIMGILNLTPDSFYDGGLYNSEKKIDNRVTEMINEGVDIIDVGGYSSRPGAKEISIDEEIKRVVPTIKFLKKEYPDLVLSIDTFRSEVAQSCLDLGVDIVNDISAGCIDEKILDIVSEYNCPYVMMHMRGNPQNMQNKPEYKNVIKELISFFAKRIYLAREKGIVDIIIDPGFGFGKTLDHNYTIMKKIENFKVLDLPMLVGISRKSFITKYLNIDKKDSLNSTTAINMYLLNKKMNILRVHDVKEAKECIMLYEKIKSS
ncbi:MAG: dihydropteroate synthase [Flavobacteriaceae bacterium]|nr:dihydropteroate synthase [Flavobacteriaceae bacterium]